MNAHDALRLSMQLSDYVLKTYLEDLSDSELFTRGCEGVNHLAWQLGHLIHSEAQLLDKVCPGASIELPSGFGEQHGGNTTGIDAPGRFLSKAEYLNLYDRQRAATRAALERFSAEALDQPGPAGMESFAPTVGAVFNLIASHPLMHAGQFAVARRKLGKPVKI